MNYLWVELNADKGFVSMADGRLGRVGALGGNNEICRHLFDSVAMAHPYLIFGMSGFHSSEDAGSVLDLQIGLAELAFNGLFNPATKLHSHELNAVADTKNRDAKFE